MKKRCKRLYRHKGGTALALALVFVLTCSSVSFSDKGVNTGAPDTYPEYARESMMDSVSGEEAVSDPISFSSQEDTAQLSLKDPDLLVGAASRVINVTAGDISSKGFEAAVREALDQAAELAASEPTEVTYTVKVPAGSYRCGRRPLCLRSNTTLDLTGVELIFDNADSESFSFFKIGDPVDTNHGYYHKNITLIGGTLDGSNKPVYMIRGAHAHHILIDGMTLKNVSTAHAMEFTACHDLTIQNTTFLDSFSTDGVNYESIQLDVMTDFHYGVGFYQEALPSYNITVKDCTFRNVMGGFGSHTAYYATPNTHILIENNVFDGISGLPVETFNWTDVTIRGNEIKNANNGILICLYGYFGSAAGTFSRNSSYIGENHDATGAYSPQYPQEVFGYPNDCGILIENNTITLNKVPSRSDNYGVRVCGLDYPNPSVGVDGSGDIPAGKYLLNGCRILNNTISSNAYGIRLSMTGSGIYVNGNTLKNSDPSTADKLTHGIFLGESSKAESIDNNTITTGGIGVYVHDGSEAKEVKDNSIRSELNQGIRSNQNSKIGSVVNNRISKSASYSIIASDSSDITNISGNTIGDAGDHGIYVFRGSSVGTIKNNRISKSAKSGILIHESSSASTISKNVILDAKESGIMMNSAQVGLIEENRISRAGTYGVFVHNGSSVRNILTNEIKTAAQAGICISNPNVAGSAPATCRVDKVSDNTISDTVSGVKLYNNSRILDLKDNSISGATGAAVAASAGSTIDSVGGNEIRNCTKGIAFGSDCKVYGIWSRQDASEAKTKSTYQYQISIPDGKSVKSWDSSNKGVATISSAGKLECLAQGNTTITALLNDGTKYTCTQKVLFRDVTDSSQFYFDAVYWGTDNNVVAGYDGRDTFRPGNDCNRAQMVTFLWRMAGNPEPKTRKCIFKDVSSSSYYYKAVLWGTENKIVGGYQLPDGSYEFRPSGQCTRQQAVTFMWRLAGSPEPSAKAPTFSDVKNPNAYYYKAVRWAAEYGVTGGYPDGTFRPGENCVRRQMVTFLYRYYNQFY